MLGSPVDLSKVDTDTYVIAGIADHLCPWQSCYRTTQLLGGPVTFVLSTSGHIASMVNPPGQPQGDVPDRGRQPGRSARRGSRARRPSAAAGGRTIRLARRAQRRRTARAGQSPAGRASRYSPQRPELMFTTGSLRSVAVGGQLLRTSVRPGRKSNAPAGAAGPAATHGRPRRREPPPLLLINGIGASLELLEPFVDALDPAIEVIRFDVPGVGGSPLPARPYRFTGLCALIGRDADRARLRHRRRPRHLLGRRRRAALRRCPAVALPPARAGQHGDRCADGAGQAERAGHDGHAAPLHRSRLPGAASRPTSTAAAPGPIPPA